MKPPGRNSFWKSGLPAMGAIVALVATGQAAALFLKTFAPERFLAQDRRAPAIDEAALEVAMNPTAVRKVRDQLAALGSRFPGQPGATKAGELAARIYAEAGLEVLRHDIRIASPLAEVRVFEALEGPGPKVEVYPFFPNHLQPVTTGSEGIEGRLVVLTPDMLRSGRDFSDIIGLIDASEGAYDSDFAFNWLRYAQLGLRALIVAHPDGLDRIPWAEVCRQKGGMVSSVPANFVRLAATPEIFAHMGKTVRLRVISRFENALTPTYLGILRAPRPAREALVIIASYDAVSYLPDLAFGPIQTLNFAAHLQLVQALAAARDSLTRDIIFVSVGGTAMANEGINQLVRVLYRNTGSGQGNAFLRALGVPERAHEGVSTRSGHAAEALAENQAQLSLVERVLAATDRPGFLADPAETRAAVGSLDRQGARFLREQFLVVVNGVAFERTEPVLQARLVLEKDAVSNPQDPRFIAYLAAKRTYDEATGAAGYTAAGLVEARPEFVKSVGLADRFRQRLILLRDYHREKQTRIKQEAAIARLFDGYQRVAVSSLRLAPSPEPGDRELLAVDAGETRVPNPKTASIFSVLTLASPPGGGGPEWLPITPRNPAGIRENIGQAWNTDLSLFTHMGYPVYGVVSIGRAEAFRRYADPIPDVYGSQLESLAGSFLASGRAYALFGQGLGTFEGLTIAEHLDRSYHGRVLIANVGPSVVPTFPAVGAAIATRPMEREELFSFPGFYQHLVVLTDPYGLYDLPHNMSDFPGRWRASRFGQTYTPLAALHGPGGRITHMKDEGPDTQRLFRSVNLAMSARRQVVTQVLFRADSVSILDLNNPQTLRDYTGVEFLEAASLTTPRHRCQIEGLGIITTFLEPDRFVYALLQSGAVDNDLLRVTRGFMLGVDDPLLPGEREIDGPGYLVADHPFLPAPPFEVARSMLLVNGRRLDLQNRYRMADPLVNRYHQQARDRLAEAELPELPLRDAKRVARESVTYSTLNHPVLRRSVLEAVFGIVWYLALLVPFVFFFEKLLFAFPDVRKQLAAQVVIFLVVFALLRLLHPAFSMVRSSLMILLGFVIILISIGITLLFSGKFRENLEELRKKAGKVTAAHANAFGVLLSAFSLGLNNMNRRKVRTGLTCLTLTLLTFVMICFTSVRNDIVDESVAITRAPYQGMLIKRERFEPLTAQEVFAFRARFGDRFPVAVRQMFLGSQDWRDGKTHNPKVSATHTGPDGIARTYELSSILQFNHTEPLREAIPIEGIQSWFTPDQDRDSDQPPAVFIPDRMAEALGLSAEDLRQSGPARIRVNGSPVDVVGIFDSGRVDAMADLDGLDLRPFDIERLAQLTVSTVSRAILAEDDDPRIPAERLLLAAGRDLKLNVPHAVGAGPIAISVAVAMPDLGYREAKEAIESFMEQTGQTIFYGLDGVSFRGKRGRDASLAGLIDLLIPLAIAGLTVLNTMRGSVYERRDEIFVYNAVGIAPRTIFFMFMAEALVYAVVGSVLGYLLSQGVGRILTEIGLTGGLNLTFASATTIYASLTIAGAVFISTYFPAKSAMEIAAPAEDSGWTLPEPEDDRLRFDLPFTFRDRDRVAVLSFFRRYLSDHGEGSAGRFFCGPPELGVRDTSKEDPTVPCLRVTVWLKPFDLAVSQTMTLSLPFDPETGLYKARVDLDRLSGTREAWIRLNRSFVALVRRHFLHWRAVPEADRAAMFAEAREAFTTAQERSG